MLNCFREQIKEVPDKMDAYIAKKYYLHATDLIVQAGILIGQESVKMTSLLGLDSALQLL